MDLNFDFNDRERKRFAANLPETAKMALELAAAIESGDGTEIFKTHLFFSMHLSSHEEMNEIILAELKRQKEFPEIIS